MYEENFKKREGSVIPKTINELRSFKEFQQMLRVMTFEKIMEMWEFNMVECIGNICYVDSDFEDFLYYMEMQGIEIRCEYEKNRIRFVNQDGTVSVVAMEERSNRHDVELPNEIVILWETLVERPLLFTDLLFEDETLASYTLTGVYHEFHCFTAKNGTDIAGAIEDTLHRLLDAGCSKEDICFHMGAVIPSEEEQRELEEYDEYINIDLNYVLPGLITSFEKKEESSYGNTLFLKDKEIAL